MNKIKAKERFSNTLNAGSMADIAFLLLIFFLVTTTISQEQGLLVRLPSWKPDVPVTKIQPRNVLKVFINADNQLLVRAQVMDLDQLKQKVIEFINNPNRDPSLAISPNKALISLQNDRGTSYETFIEVYDNIKAAYTELRNESAMLKYGKTFMAISRSEKQLIRQKIPMAISEAEPVSFGEEGFVD